MDPGESGPTTRRLTEGEIERLRSRLRVDRGGDWWFDDLPVTHARTVRLLIEHLCHDGEGRLIVQLGPAWSYVRCDDTPLVVRDVTLPDDSEAADATVRIVLFDGVEEALDPDTLTVGADDALYCRVRDGRFEARFLRAAHYRLAAHVVEHSPEPFALVLAGRRWPIGRRG